jgi:glutamine phosphoribosylpyrophosphate amidotransferase
MCAVIGAIFKQPNEGVFETIRRVFLESRIRGMHATGFSYVKGGSVHTIKEPINAKEFVSKYFSNMDEYVNEDGNLYMIGHCRYSTSDLEYNQPIANVSKSIVHNGVVTQELPENWKELYGYDTETKNDSEFILKSDNPIEEFPDASMSVCELTSDKKLTLYRNGKRPLSLTTLEKGCIITSTENIAKRAGLSTSSDVLMNTKITFDQDIVAMFEKINPEVTHVDYQNYELYQ